MQNINYAFLLSRPVWGAWIEIVNKYFRVLVIASRAPYGARGLKFAIIVMGVVIRASRPVWGAWIEIVYVPITSSDSWVAPRMGRVD